MPSITKNHFEILLHPSLRLKWLALDFTNLQTILTKYFNEEIVSEICQAAIIDKKDAVEKLHRSVIQSDNEDLYMDILNFCKEKCKLILDLCHSMSINNQDRIVGDVNENFSPIKRRRKQPTRNQCSLKEQLELCLNKSTILYLLEKYFDGGERVNDAVISRLLKSNTDFHDEIFLLLNEKKRIYKDCHEFMHHHQSMEHNNVQLLTSSGCTSVCTSNQNMSLYNLQLELCKLKVQVNNLTNEVETKMNVSTKFHNQLHVPTYPINIKIDFVPNDNDNYPYQLRVFASQTLLDLKRSICIYKFKHIRTEELKLIHLETLLLDDNMTLYEHGLVEHSSIKCIKKSETVDFIKVFVQNQNNKREKIKVSTKDTVKWLKAEYSERTGILLTNLKLLFNNKEMDDHYYFNYSIGHYGVKNNSIIFLSSS